VDRPLVEGVQVGQRTAAALGDTVGADRARLLSALGWAISLSCDYATATATFDKARALAEQVGNERALADVLHMQTIHHLSYGEFATGVRVGLQAAEMFERESALWDLCSVLAFVIYEDGTLGSREQAAKLADKTLDIAERLGHIGAAFLVIADRSVRRRCSVTCRRWRRSVRRSWTSPSRADCPGAISATFTWAWPGTGETTPRAPNPSCARRSSWSRRPRSPGRALHFWRGTLPTKVALTR
jgi:hypothetical protein